MKKFLALTLSLAMALSLAACGNSSSSGDSTSGSGSQTASDGNITIRIGGIGPLTGGNATYGLATYYGAQIAVDEINALGIGPQGFGGRTTCLGLAIEQMPTHVAGLPVAVNVSCHVTRRASAEL